MAKKKPAVSKKKRGRKKKPTVRRTTQRSSGASSTGKTPSHREPILAFSAASLFRKESKKDFHAFLHRHMFQLCSQMKLIATEGTLDFVARLLKKRRHRDILFGPDHPVETDAEYRRWRGVITKSLTSAGKGTRGMVAITAGVVEGTVSAVHHFTDREDVERSIYTRVLSRQSSVHHVPIANDLETASAMATVWHGRRTDELFEQRSVAPPLEKLGVAKTVLALIAHDQKKLEICDFVVRFGSQIRNKYDALITTGTTGQWIQRFLISVGHQRYARNVILCNSGPLGGDVQIANAVCEGKCQDVIFFQDPATSHPHDVDIRLFEQAIHDKAENAATAHLARNWETARFIIEA